MDILIILILIIITIGSYIYIEKIYRKYKKEDLKCLKSGFEISRKIIDNYDLNNIYITESRDALFSYYDSNRKVIKLVKEVFSDTSITSCAISAFNAQSAIDDKNNNKLFKFRNNFKDLVNIILYLGYLVIAVGALFGHMNTILIGIALEYMVLLFYIATYKLDRDTKKKALKELLDNKLITKKELKKVEEALRATSFIYIASIVFPIAKLIKLIIDFGNSNKN